MKGTMTETKPGVWRLRVVVGYDDDGRPRQASRTFRGTRRGAQKELAHFVADADSAVAPLTGVMTLSAYLEKWMEHVKAHRQPDTIRNYELRRKLFAKELGTVRLDKLRSHQLDELYRQWMAHGLAPSTIKAYHGVLSAALSQAIKWGLIERSVAPLVTLPTVPPRRLTPPGIDAIRILVSESDEKEPVLSAAILLAALTGCRRGELMGLRWSDIDAERSLLRVQRSVKRNSTNRGLLVGPTKTHQDRLISLDEVMLAVLETHRLRAEAWAEEAGAELDPEGFILSEDPTGLTPIDPDVLTHRFSRLAVRCGLSGVRFHDLRHSVATNLLGAGYDLAVVAGRLGHRDPTITLRVYAHALEQRDRQAAATLGSLWAKALPAGSSGT